MRLERTVQSRHPGTASVRLPRRLHHHDRLGSRHRLHSSLCRRWRRRDDVPEHIEVLGRETSLIYVVEELVTDERIRLRGENTTVISMDTMTFGSAAARTEVTYTAEFTFKGPSRLLAPLLKPAFTRLGSQAESGLRSALTQL
jgi:hypothetical protein